MTMYKQYCTNHLSVKLSLAYTLPRTNEARLISLVVDNSFTERKSHTAHPTFHPAILFKMMLFAYARKVFYGRKMIQMTEEVLPMKWLSQDTYVSFETITNFRSNKLANNLIKVAFIYLILLMCENGMIEDEAFFINGTKLEVDANLYYFTWEKAVKALKRKTAELYDNLVQEEGDLTLSKEACKTSKGLMSLLEDTEQDLVAVEKFTSKDARVIKGG